jgi:hypothetical protein
VHCWECTTGAGDECCPYLVTGPYAPAGELRVAAGTFIILVASELCLLLRLLIPKLIEFGEARYDAVYGHAHGDRPFIPTPIQPEGD